MKEYELVIESYNPCGGTAYAQKKFMEIETDDPVAYVKDYAKVDKVNIFSETADETILMVEENGYVQKYYFTEI